ncbi:MAG: thiamine-phosphate kinase [Nitrospirae bacterium]|nr:MAG: thiamine-phosphate kinase [Nitrospirota bacterium]
MCSMRRARRSVENELRRHGHARPRARTGPAVIRPAGDMAAPASRGSLRDLGEFRLIAALKRSFATPRPELIRGIGDDAAVIRWSADSHLLISTDLLTEQVHFDRHFASTYDIGYRGAVANLSDIAAMGGQPLYVLAALALPPSCSINDVRSLYRGMMAPCRKAGVALIGGDTSASRAGLHVTITILGRVEPNRVLTRNGARIGDILYVSGTLGDAYAGLRLLQASARSQSIPLIPPRFHQFLRARHLRPTARLALGRLLSTRQLASAAIDLSDGLSGDLGHLCRESRVGAEIDSTALPLSKPCRTLAAAWNQDPMDWALTGGEDYELLFTVPQDRQHRLERLARSRGEPITPIGRICSPRYGIRLKMPDGTTRNIAPTSYEHFRSSL